MITLFAGVWMLFAFEALVFVALCIAYSITESSNFSFYAILIVAFSVAVAFLGVPLPTLASVPMIVLYSVIYLAGGVVWSFFKWYRFTHNETNIAIQKRDFASFKAYMTNVHETDQNVLMAKFLKSDDNPFNFRNSKPQFWIHKWVIYWPISVVADIFGDLLLNLVKHVVSSFGGVYDKIAGGTKNLV